MSDAIREYETARQGFLALTRSAFQLSEACAGRSVPDWTLEYGSYLFAKAAMHADAILKLAPEITSSDTPQRLDPSSIAVLARALVDTYLILWYVACDEVDEQEAAFRALLWQYHSEKARLSKLDLIGSTSAKVEEIRRNVLRLKADLIADNHYKTLDNDRQRRVRQGREAWLLTNSEIAQRAGISVGLYKTNYKFLSAYIHSHPFSLSQIAGFYEDPEGIFHITKTMLSEATGYLAHAMRDFNRVCQPKPNPISSVARDIIDKWVFIFENFDDQRDGYTG